MRAPDASSRAARDRDVPPALSVVSDAEGWRVRVESRAPEFDDEGRVALLVTARFDDGALESRALSYPGAAAEWRAPRSARRVRVEAPGLGLACELTPLAPVEPRRATWVRVGVLDRAALRPEAVQRALVRAQGVALAESSASRAPAAASADGARPPRRAAVESSAALSERAAPAPRGPRGGSR